MANTAAIAELGALVGDPGRVNMLTALLDGRPLTACELAECAGVTAQTASGHLSKLLAAGMLRVERQGRHRYHRLASADIAQLLEAMHVAAAQVSPRGRPRSSGPVDDELRLARICYDHIAGRLGVALTDVLCTIEMDYGDRHLSPGGEASLSAWGLDLARMRCGRRVFQRSCLDWTERRPHLAGALGAAVLQRSLDLGWVRRRTGTRSLAISPAGRLGFQTMFGVVLS